MNTFDIEVEKGLVEKQSAVVLVGQRAKILICYIV